MKVFVKKQSYIYCFFCINYLQFFPLNLYNVVLFSYEVKMFCEMIAVKFAVFIFTILVCLLNRTFGGRVWMGAFKVVQGRLTSQAASASEV